MGEMNAAQLHYVEVMCESILHGKPDLSFFVVLTDLMLLRHVLRVGSGHHMVALVGNINYSTSP